MVSWEAPCAEGGKGERRVDKSGGRGGCPFGSHRSIDPPNALPQLAWKLDASLPIRDNELLVRVETLNINPSSFSQLCGETGRDPEQLIRKVCSIVSLRGKMHNPITGSGGTLMGTVAEIGRDHPAYGKLRRGQRICTLISLGLTPLVIERVKSLNMRTGQLELDGYAILFQTGLYTPVPEEIDTHLFLAVSGEAGSVYQANLLCEPGMTAMVTGSMGTAGLLSLFSLRQKLGEAGTLIAIAEEAGDAEVLEALGVADRIVPADMNDPLSAYEAVRAQLGPLVVDLTVDCSSVPGAEMFSILMTRERGTVYFTNPAAHYSGAGLGAEGIGKEVNLLLYRGYIPGHVPFCLQLLRQYPALERCFRARYSPENAQDQYDYQGESAPADDIPPNIIARGAEMTEVIRIAKRIAPFNTTVLITGETGTGKDVVANLLHQFSVRCDKPFIKINCSAISENLFESELFGYERGSFTGALKEGRAGYFEAANHGTLFLDEIGDMPLASQVKLLRVLQSKEVVRIGSSQAVPVDVRVILATNRNLRAMVQEGTFREDLYYRINIINLYMPPLRERRGSIQPLAESFLQQYGEKYGVRKHLSRSALEMFLAYDWPGNIREMENMIQRLLLCSGGEVITGEELRRELRKNAGEGQGREPLAAEDDAAPSAAGQEEARYRAAAARWHSTREIARALGTSQSTVVRRLRKYGLRPGGGPENQA